MRIAKGMDTCRLEDKVKFIFVIKEVMDYRTNKAGANLGERQTLGKRLWLEARWKSPLR